MTIDLQRILHVEDEGPLLMLVRRMLPGLVIDEAVSIQDAVAMIEKTGNAYDVILLDPGLPDSQGLESIRTIHLCSNAPIVVNTGGDTKDIEALADALGVFEILHKDTATANAIRRALEGAIAKHALRRVETALDEVKERKEKFRRELLNQRERD